MILNSHRLSFALLASLELAATESVYSATSASGSGGEYLFLATDRGGTLNEQSACLQNCAVSSELFATQPLQSHSSFICTNLDSTDVTTATGFIAVNTDTGKLSSTSGGTVLMGGGAKEQDIDPTSDNYDTNLQYASISKMELQVSSGVVANFYFADNNGAPTEQDAVLSGVFENQNSLHSMELMCLGTEAKEQTLTLTHLELLEGAFFKNTVTVTSVSGTSPLAGDALLYHSWDFADTRFETPLVQDPYMVLDFGEILTNGIGKIKLLKQNSSGDFDWSSMELLPFPEDTCDQVDCSVYKNVRDYIRTPRNHKIVDIACTFVDQHVFIEATNCLYPSQRYIVASYGLDAPSKINIIGQVVQESTTVLPVKTGYAQPNYPEDKTVYETYIDETQDALTISVPIVQGETWANRVKIPFYEYDLVEDQILSITESDFGILESYVTLNLGDEGHYYFNINLTASPDLGTLPISGVVRQKQQFLSETSTIYYVEIQYEITIACIAAPPAQAFECTYDLDDIYSNSDSLGSSACQLVLATDPACPYTMYWQEESTYSMLQLVQVVEDGLTQYSLNLVYANVAQADITPGTQTTTMGKTTWEGEMFSLTVEFTFFSLTQTCTDLLTAPTITDSPFTLFTIQSSQTYDYSPFTDLTILPECGILALSVQGTAESISTVTFNLSSTQLEIDPTTAGTYTGEIVATFTLATNVQVRTSSFSVTVSTCASLLTTFNLGSSPYSYVQGDGLKINYMSGFASFANHPVCGDILLSIQGDAAGVSSVEQVSAVIKLTFDPTTAGTYTGEIKATFSSDTTVDVRSSSFQVTISTCASLLVAPTITDSPYRLQLGEQTTLFGENTGFSTFTTHSVCGDVQLSVSGAAQDFTSVVLGGVSAGQMDITIDPSFSGLQSYTTYDGQIVANFDQAPLADSVTVDFSVTFYTCSDKLTAPSITGSPFFVLNTNLIGDTFDIDGFASESSITDCGSIQLSVIDAAQDFSSVTMDIMTAMIELRLSSISGTATGVPFDGQIRATFEHASNVVVTAPFQVSFQTLTEMCTDFLVAPEVTGSPFSLVLGDPAQQFPLQSFADFTTHTLCGDLQLSVVLDTTADVSTVTISITDDLTQLMIDPITDGTFTVNIIATFTTADQVHVETAPFEIVILVPVNCADLLTAPTMPDSPFELTLGDSPQTFELDGFAEFAEHTDCGTIELAVTGDASEVATVAFLTDSSGRLLVDTEGRIGLTIDPSVETINSLNSYAGEIAASFSEATDVSVGAPFEITFIDGDGCTDATIEYDGTDPFTAEYLIVVADLTEEVENLEIEWPSLVKNFDESQCAATVTTEVSYLGANGLSALWVTQDLDNEKTVVNLLDSSITGLTADKVVITTVTATLTRDSADSTEASELATVELNFTIKFETSEQPEDEELAKEEEPEVELEPESESEQTSDNKESSTFKFEGVKVKEEQEPEASAIVVKIPDPIKTSISLASVTGRILISFSRAFQVDFGTLDRRLLQDDTDESNNDKNAYSAEEMKKLEQLVVVKYETATEEDEGEVSQLIKTEVVRATTTEIEFQMVYSLPLAVSRNPQDPDLLVFEFREDVFSDPLTDISVNKGEPLIVALPRQIEPAEAEAIEGAMTVANSAGNAVATGNIVVNVLLGASLKYLWGMINTLQFVVFFTDWDVQMPPNASIAIETFRTIALGEFIPYDWLTDIVLGIFKSEDDVEGATEYEEEDSIEDSDDDESEDADFENGESTKVEVDKSNVLANMGVMLVFLVILIVMILLVLLLVRFCKKGSALHNKFLQVKAKIFWNSIFRFILQSYLKTALGCMFAVRLISFSTGAATANALVSLAMLVTLSAIPFIFAVLMHKNKERLSRSAVKAKMGTLYLGSRTKTLLQRIYPSVFVFRRLLYAILTVVCISNPNILIHVYLLSNVMYVVYLGTAEPNDTMVGRRVEYFNEAGLQIVTYHLALFPLALTIDGESMLGWSMIGWIVLIFIVNLGVMLTMTIIGIRRKLYLKNLKKKALEKAELKRQKQLQNASDETQAKLKGFTPLLPAPPVELSKVEALKNEFDIYGSSSSESSEYDSSNGSVAAENEDQMRKARMNVLKNIEKIDVKNEEASKNILEAMYLGRDEPVEDTIRRIETDFLTRYGNKPIVATTERRSRVESKQKVSIRSLTDHN